MGTQSPADVTGQLRGPGMTGGSMLNVPNSPAVTCHDPVDSRGKYFYNYNKVLICVCVHYDLVNDENKVSYLLRNLHICR